MSHTELPSQKNLDQLEILVSDAAYESPELTPFHRFPAGRLGACVGLDGIVDDRTSKEIEDDFAAMARKEIAAGELLRIGGVIPSRAVQLPSNIIDLQDPKFL